MNGSVEPLHALDEPLLELLHLVLVASPNTGVWPGVGIEGPPTVVVLLHRIAEIDRTLINLPKQVFTLTIKKVKAFFHLVDECGVLE